MTSSESHIGFLDLLRIVACFLVIVNHTNSAIFLSTTPEHLTWYVSLTYFFVSKIAVPIFFMISGYLLLSRIDTWKKTSDRILRIAMALIVCAVVYSTYQALRNPDISFLKVIKDSLAVYYTPPINGLWYLYTYLGILFMLPFLQKMVHMMKKRDYHIFFAISGFFVSVLPILNHYFPTIRYNDNFQLPLFGGYICMLLIGQYFARFKFNNTRRGFVIASILFVSMLIFNVTATFFEYNKSSADYLFFDNRIYLPILLQSACVFYMASFIHVPDKYVKIISHIGSCTFGIYLISDITIDLLIPMYIKATTVMNPFFAVIILELLVFGIGLLAITILKKVPLIKKLL